jgi:hypothetical protein
VATAWQEFQRNGLFRSLQDIAGAVAVARSCAVPNIPIAPVSKEVRLTI